MKTSAALAALAALLALALLAGTASAEESSPFPVAEALDAQMKPLAWQRRWDAYQEVKDDLTAEREALGPARDAWRKREAEGEAALSDEEKVLAATWDAFIPVQTRVADALRRDQLSLGAILMGFFAATLLWGGFAVTVTVAIRSEKQKKAAAGA